MAGPGDKPPAECEERFLAAIVAECPAPVIECDARGFPVYLNPAARTILDDLGVDLYDFLPANHIEIILDCLAQRRPALEIEVVAADRVFSWSYQPSLSSSAVHLYANEVSRRNEPGESSLQDALQDPLTGLPNRALLNDRLARSADLLQRHADYLFAVLLLDLDRFKVVNESLGYAGGDRLLVDVCERLQACVKQSDTVARTGGDEFVILLEDISSHADPSRVAERIHRELERPFRVGDREVFVTASMGIAVATGEAAEPSGLMRDAEAAMYRSKKDGKYRYTIYDQTMHDQAAELVALEADLRLALGRKQLFVVYQPVVSTSSMRITGFEALVRWQHPSRGLVSPAEFIPLAEETGLIMAIDDWVAREACRQIRAWHKAGYPHLAGSINVTGRNFRSPDLFERIESNLVRAGLDPRFLKVEVTENVTARDAAFAVQTLGRFRQAGIQVMIDDFGTGYSSLSYLKRLPIDVLKIDRSFIQDSTTEPTSGAVVITIILMAHALGMEVVAEGVETKDQLELLHRHNCDYIQGYLFSKPIPADAFTTLLERGVQPA